MKTMEHLLAQGCEHNTQDKVCRSRGGESCAFDGAMIVLQPIADSAHIVHGPSACCGNSWEGRGTLSSQGDLHTMGFTTDMSELDIVYGSEGKLYEAILQTFHAVKPKAIFVYATCVSGLIGEEIENACKKAEAEIGIRVIPVASPGFVGPKNLGNRIAGEALLEHVIGTGEPTSLTPCDIALIGEYNIAGDLWNVEPLLKEAGIRVLSHITGDGTFDEITYAHRAKASVVVCSRALINVAHGLKARYGIPFCEVSFFGKTEMSKALRSIASLLAAHDPAVVERVEALIGREEEWLAKRLEPFRGLRGKKAALYTGGVKSWSFISALMDLGIEIVAVGTKKSSKEDEEKMRAIMGENAPLLEDITPASLLRLMKEKGADILIAGGRNQYLGVKEAYPFVDVNQERHLAYAGYEGLVTFAGEIMKGITYYRREREGRNTPVMSHKVKEMKGAAVIDPLRHSPALGAAMAFQGIDRAIPVIHGAQGCTFLGKVLLTRHFREPISLATTKLFAEDVVMGSEGNLSSTLKTIAEKNKPDLIGVLTTGLSEVKGDDVGAVVRGLASEGIGPAIVQASTADYDGGLETGYARAVEAVLNLVSHNQGSIRPDQVNILAGSHLTSADCTEVRETVESFGLRPIILPDLSCLDGRREGMSALASGGTSLDEIREMGHSAFTIVIGPSLVTGALKLRERFGTEYRVFDSLTGLAAMDEFCEVLSALSGTALPSRYERQRKTLRDTMRDAHFFYGGKRVCIALEPDLAVQTSQWLTAMGAEVVRAVIPQKAASASLIRAGEVILGDLSCIGEGYDLIIANSHAERRAKGLGIPLYPLGFPLHTVLGAANRATVGYRGSMTIINEIGNIWIHADGHGSAEGSREERP
ncbi:MAG: nitrogenase iron-molybdenum cofactor biosynthesis protein NifE [Nitrospirales bacterium]|nr:nitrogenase iron-molybdenum cofactor biosynthesis protein NifE [Nitrospirales bacterium]